MRLLHSWIRIRSRTILPLTLAVPNYERKYINTIITTEIFALSNGACQKLCTAKKFSFWKDQETFLDFNKDDMKGLSTHQMNHF